jgi:HTH-type transcriptional regulator, sugar sensing transcriptional regulator
MLQEVFTTLGFREEEVKTYLSLLDAGGSTAGNLAKVMGMPRPTVYGYLEKLQVEGLVTQSKRSGIKLFLAEPGEKIRLLYKRRIAELQKRERSLDSLLPELEKRSGLNVFRPRLQFDEGQAGIQKILEDLLQYRDIETFVMWPIEKMMDIMTDEYTHYHNKERLKRNISIRVIWPRNQTKDLHKWPYISSGKEFLREIRLAPTDVDFSMGYWAYANKVAFISSRAESFGFIIESAELVSLMRVKHDIIWNNSEPFPFRSRFADHYLQEIAED